MYPNLTVGDYVSGYKLDGDVLIINKHEASSDQSGTDPFLYSGIISRIAVNAFQIDDVIIDYTHQKKMLLFLIHFRFHYNYRWKVIPLRNQQKRQVWTLGKTDTCLFISIFFSG